MDLMKIKEEYSKVQWPKKKTIIYSTAWVVLMSVVLIAYLFVFDLLANGVLNRLVARFGG